MVRTQLYLDEALHARLRVLARKHGKTLSELVREALKRTYGTGGREERLATLRAISGLWTKRTDIGDTRVYVRRLRRGTHRNLKLKG